MKYWLLVWAGFWLVLSGCEPGPASAQNFSPAVPVSPAHSDPPLGDTVRPPYLLLDSSEIKFGNEIEFFRLADSISFPKDVQVVFNGSSSIRKWDSLERDMPGLRVLNRGFGGSTIRMCTYYAPRIVLPYHPDAIVFYAGENDLAYDELAPDSLPLQSFREYVRLIHFFHPETHIFFISMKPSPSRKKHQGRFDRGNALVKAYTESDERLHYIDVASKMRLPDGSPLPDIWLKDKLHMNEKGYAIWRRQVHGVLSDFFRQKEGQ